MTLTSENVFMIRIVKVIRKGSEMDPAMVATKMSDFQILDRITLS